MLHVSNGRAEILPSAQQRFQEAHVLIRTVMVISKRNPNLDSFSETSTTLNITPPS